jgi:hypothetical protein
MYSFEIRPVHGPSGRCCAIAASKNERDRRGTLFNLDITAPYEEGLAAWVWDDRVSARVQL